MLVGPINNTKEHGFYPKIVTDTLSFLAAQDLSTLALGRHEIPFVAPEKAWFVVIEYQKEPLTALLPEVHKYHSDLQMILSGSEIMAWALDSGDHELSGDYLVARDLQFYQQQGIELNFFKAVENQFYLFTPNTIHVTNIEDGNHDPVRKLVVKIHNDLLMEQQ